MVKKIFLNFSEKRESRTLAMTPSAIRERNRRAAMSEEEREKEKQKKREYMAEVRSPSNSR